jgi:membrane-associated phospholipid phosphatase
MAMENWLPYIPLIVLPFWAALNLGINRYVSRRPRHHRTDIVLDVRLPFIPGFALPYFSAYVLGLLGYVLMITHPDLGKVLWGYLFLVGIGSLCYVVFPSTAVRREDLAVVGFSTYMLVRFQRLSGPYNVFPSMHFGYCLFSALAGWYYHGHLIGGGLTLWAVLIGVSTLLTKQHYILDLVGGLVVGVLAFVLVVRL